MAICSTQACEKKELKLYIPKYHGMVTTEKIKECVFDFNGDSLQVFFHILLRYSSQNPENSAKK